MRPSGASFSRAVPAACGALLAVVATNQVSAQQAADKDKKGGADQLQEVTVTAERVETNLQTTPISVLSVSGEEMKEKGAANIAELASFLPNVSIGPSVQGGGSSQPQFAIRGVSQIETGISGDRAVGFYVDDQFFARTTGSMLRALDLQDVEVLRGPQGTLFGRNNTAGAIKFTTQKPTDQFSATVSSSFGDFNRANGSAILNVPLTDNIFFRTSVAKYFEDGFVIGENGQTKGGVNEIDARAALRFKIGDDVTYDLSFTNSDSDEPGFASNLVGSVNPYDLTVLACQIKGACPRATPFVTFPGSNSWVGVPIAPDPDYTSAVKVTGDPYRYVGGDQEYDNTHEKIINGTLNWHINPNLSVRLISGGLKINENQFADTDETPLPIGTSSGETYHRSWSQELHFIFKDLFGGKLDGIGGLYYFHEHNDAVFTNSGYDDTNLGGLSAWSLLQQLNGRTDTSATFPLLPGETFPYTTAGAFPGQVLGVCPGYYPFGGTPQAPTPVAGSTALMGCINPLGLGITSTVQQSHSTAASRAAFLDFTWHWTDKLSTSQGVRYTKDVKSWSIDNQQTAYGQAIPGQGGTWSATDWRFIAKYQWTPDIMTYASASKAYKSGGFSDGVAFGFGGFAGFQQNKVGVSTLNPITGQVIDSPFIPYKPETVINYEFGIRTEWAHRLRANLTVFDMNYDNKQVTILILPGQNGGNTPFANNFGGGQIIINASKVVIRGAEGELNFAATDHLILGANLAYLDAFYKQLDPLVGSIDLHTPLERAPKYTITLGPHYDHALLGGSASAQINWVYTAEQFSGADKNTQWRIPPVALMNTRVGYTSGDGSWNAAFFVNNALNKEYLYGGISFASQAAGARSFQGTGTNEIFPAAPRTFGLDFTYYIGAHPHF